MPNDALYETLGVDVFYLRGENLCLRITNSKNIQGLYEIERTLRYIHFTNEYKALVKAGYNRTLKSQAAEWAAHNVLSRWGFLKHQSNQIDISNNVSKLRRALYQILSIFER